MNYTNHVTNGIVGFNVPFVTLYTKKQKCSKIVVTDCISVLLILILTMHINVIMGGQLHEHLLFWQPSISITLYVIALYLVWFLRWK